MTDPALAAICLPTGHLPILIGLHPGHYDEIVAICDTWCIEGITPHTILTAFFQEFMRFDGQSVIEELIEHYSTSELAELRDTAGKELCDLNGKILMLLQRRHSHQRYNTGTTIHDTTNHGD